MEWIKTSDQIPPDDEDVLVFISDEEETAEQCGYVAQFGIASYNSGSDEWESIDNSAIQDGCIPSHWMPLVQPA